MTFESIENFYTEKGNLIAGILLSSYNSADFELETLKIESEIYEMGLSYAKIFFFESRFFLSVESREDIRSHIRSRFDVKDKKLEKMKDVELLAHCIKSVAIDMLREHNFLLS